MALADLRREYNLTGLRRRDLHENPIEQFKRWFAHAANERAAGRLRKFFVNLYKSLLMLSGAEMGDVNAMVLATVDEAGNPSARVVLLKGVDERGFIFYTNYDSRKGQELTRDPHAALVFYWPDLERQICVKGETTKLSEADSDAYFHSRPRGARIGAWASNQSREVRDRMELEQKWTACEKQYEGKDVPRPPHWGGYAIRPLEIEFWQGRPNRMHDRFRYTRQADNNWKIERLSP